MDCAGCPEELPEIRENNRWAWWAYQKLAGVLRDRMGGYNLQNLEIGLNRLQIPGEAQTGVWEKIMILLTHKEA